MSEETSHPGADQPTSARSHPRASFVFSVLSNAERPLALAWAVAARLPEQAEVVLVGPSNLVRASLDRWPSRLTVVELPGSSVDSAEQRRRGATAATGDLIRFIDVGESEGSADPHEATLEWADRLRFRNAGPP